jgi:hypothetical protein
LTPSRRAAWLMLSRARLLRGLDVGFFPEAQGGIEVEISATLDVIGGNGHELGPARHGRRGIDATVVPSFGRIEFGLQFANPDFLARILGGEANRDIAQFAYIPGKRVGQQTLQGCGIKAKLRKIGLCRVDGPKVLQQQDAVLAEVAQWRNGDGEHGKAVIQVGAEAAFANFLFQVAIGCRDHARRGVACGCFANALELAVLQHPQQLGLQVEWKLADFVEEQRAVRRFLEIAGPLAAGPGERSLAWPKSVASTRLGISRRS